MEELVEVSRGYVRDGIYVTVHRSEEGGVERVDIVDGGWDVHVYGWDVGRLRKAMSIIRPLLVGKEG
jgi:hypothetical protein